MSSWSLNYPDLGAAFSSGVQSGTQLGQNVVNKQQLDQANRERRQLMEAQQADLQAKQGVEAQAVDQADMVKDVQLFKNMSQHLLSVRDDPQRYEQAYNSLVGTIRKERPDWAANIPDVMLTPDEVQGMVMDIDRQLSGAGAAEPMDKSSAQARAAIADELGRPELAAPGMLEQYAQATGDQSILQKLGQYTRSVAGITTPEEAQALAKSKAINVNNTVNAPVNVDTGRMDLSSENVNKEQRTVLDTTRTIATVDRLMSMIPSEEEFGLLGAAKRVGSGVADVTGSMGIASVEEFQNKRSEIDRKFKTIGIATVELAKNLNGAGVMTDEDFQRIAKIVQNAATDTVVGRRSLISSLEAVRDTATLKKDLASSALDLGIQIRDPQAAAGQTGGPAPAAAQGSDVLGQVTKSVPPDQRKRILELRKQGLDAAQVREQLRKEGML